MTTYVDLEKTREELIVHYDKVRWQSNGSFDDFIRAFHPSDDCLLKSPKGAEIAIFADAAKRIRRDMENDPQDFDGQDLTDLCESADLILALSAEKEKLEAENKKMRQWYRQPTHGPCCTCQKCGQDYDTCRCSLDEVADELAKAEAEVRELEKYKLAWDEWRSLQTGDAQKLFDTALRCEKAEARVRELEQSIAASADRLRCGDGGVAQYGDHGRAGDANTNFLLRGYRFGND